MTIPAEMLAADAVSVIFLTLGALFLMRFFLNFGTRRLKAYSIVMCSLIIAFAVLHMGLEMLYGLYGIGTGVSMLSVTASVSTVYFLSALLLRREMKNLMSAGGRKHG